MRPTLRRFYDVFTRFLCQLGYVWLVFFALIAIFDAAFCGDFNSSRFWNSNVIILLINSLQVCGAFPLLVCTVINLGRRIIYGNCKAVNTTKHSFRTTWPYCNIEFIEFFYFELISSHITFYKYIIYFHSFLFSYLNSNIFPSLHGEHFEINAEKSFCRIDEWITL